MEERGVSVPPDAGELVSIAGRTRNLADLLPTTKARSVMSSTPVALDAWRALDRAGELR
jgi:hypothetical protein